jgi:hypothetical protein
MEFTMSRFLAAAALTILASAAFVPDAHAVVYCKTVGVPKGCVVRPAGAVVVTPATTTVVTTPPAVVVRPVVRPVRRTVIVR